MSEGITSDVDLQNLANKINVRLNGLYFKDELPQIPQEGHYIINLASSTDNSGGTHWCCFHLAKNHKAIYFDPFGQPEPVDVSNFMMKWVRNKHNNIIRNNKVIQQLSSNFCGQYCLYFLKSIQKNKGTLKQKLHNFINQFNIYGE
jgi:hypothetical protein